MNTELFRDKSLKCIYSASSLMWRGHPKHTHQNFTSETQPLSRPLDVSRQEVPLLSLVMHCHGYYCHGDEQSDPPIGKIVAAGGRV